MLNKISSLAVAALAFAELRNGGGEVYLTREQEGLWHLERWTRSAPGAWSGVDLVAPGSVRLARPWPVTPRHQSLGVVALALERYPDDSYFGTLSNLIGTPG